MSNVISQLIAQNDIAHNIQEQDRTATEAKKADRKARTTRPAQKAVKTESIVKKAAPVLAVKYALSFRPGSGENLASYTHAWMTLLGMFDGKAYPRKTLEAIAGKRAISNHLHGTGAFEMTDNGIQLSDLGYTWFNPELRKVRPNPEIVAKYQDIMKTGKIDGELVKDKSIVTAIAYQV